ncbi:MAG: aminoacetone oxidase family FAD-binding enzyme [Spirochaetia bacterium]|nr:aminoacetone oxidase family FAD-binding enzyme [Spirochaetia bacterium]
MYDVIIIGAGAAGLFLAANISTKNVLLLEGSPRVGKKILITGGGMCNLTNNKDTPTFLKHFGSKEQTNFLKPSLQNLPTDKTRLWFEGHGLPLTEREDGKVFPSYMSAKAVVDLLEQLATKNGVETRVNAKVIALDKDAQNGIYIVQTEHEQFQTKAVVLTTGGMSYPATGSDGSGYALAKMLGHSIVSPSPALVAVTVAEYPFTAMAGNSIRGAMVEFFHKNATKRYHQATGDMLFTHDGLSGPVILNNSRDMHKGDLLQASLLHCSNKEELKTYLIGLFSAHPKKQLYTLLKGEGIIAHLAEQLLHSISLTIEDTCANLSKDKRAKLIELLTAYPFTVSSKKGFNAAMVTSGGVALDEVDRKTMGSRLQKDLYLCGEILDIDGNTGGYNLQAAFSTAKLAADAIQK